MNYALSYSSYYFFMNGLANFYGEACLRFAATDKASFCI